jgi:hypothetical protein
MQLSEALRLVRTIQPEAMRHRDHICSEAAAHDLAHCPKMLSQIYAWRVRSNISAKPISRVQPERIRSRPGPVWTSQRGRFRLYNVLSQVMPKADTHDLSSGNLRKQHNAT